MNRGIGVWRAAGVLLLAVVGCSSGSSATGSADLAQPPGNTFATSCLGQCVATSCANEIAACNGDPSCAAYLACVDACTVSPSGDADTACVAQCPAPSGSAGTDAKNALAACQEQAATNSCASCTGAAADAGAPMCPGIPALVQQCAPSSQTDPCVKCQFEKCCDSVNKVFNGGPATDFANCWQMCKDFACVQACIAKYPDGVMGFGEYDACAKVECSATGACTPGNDYSKCLNTKCACEYAACRTDPGCFLVTECQANCTDVACSEACLSNATGASVDITKTYGVCAAQRCVTECGGG